MPRLKKECKKYTKMNAELKGNLEESQNAMKENNKLAKTNEKLEKEALRRNKLIERFHKSAEEDE